MKKFAWILTFALMLQLLAPMSVSANTTNENSQTLSTDAVFATVGEEVYHQIYDTQEEQQSYYSFAMMTAAEHAVTWSEKTEYALTSVAVDGNSVDNSDSTFVLSVQYQYDIGKYCLTVRGLLDSFDLSLATDHTIDAVITHTDPDTAEVTTYSMSHTFQLAELAEEYTIVMREAEYVPAGYRSSIRINHPNMAVSASGVTVKKLELKDENGAVYGSKTSFYPYSQYSSEDIRYVHSGIYSQCREQIFEANGIGAYSSQAYSFLSYVSPPSDTLYVSKQMNEGFYDLVYTLSDGSTYTLKNAYQAVSNSVVYDVIDTQYTADGEIFTDQTGEYVSVYVYGWNVGKDTVKPVFYDSASNEISGEVAAVETGDWGSFFRLQKKESAEWDQLSNQGTPYTVLVEPVNENSTVLDKRENTNTYIYRQTDYYSYYSSINRNYYIYLSADTDIDETAAVTMDISKNEYNNQETIIEGIEGTVEKRTNTLSGMDETRLVFPLTEEQVSSINSIDRYYRAYTIQYTNSANEAAELNSRYASVKDFEGAREKGSLSGRTDNLFYLPYVVGAVHLLQAEESGTYALTAQDAAALGTDPLCYKTGTLNTLDQTNCETTSRSYYSSYFWREGSIPAKPEGTPVLTAAYHADGTVTLNWTEVQGADGYEIYLQIDSEEYGSYSNYVANVTEGTTYTESLSEMSYMLQELITAGADISDLNIKFYVQPYAQNSDATVEGNPSNTVTMNMVNPGAEAAAPSSVTLSKTSYTYTGSRHEPSVTVKDENGNMIAAENYSVSYENNVNAGSAAVIVTFRGDYEGAKALKAAFTIQKASASSVKLSKTSYTYTGKEITPTFEIGEETLSKTNYKITKISNNKKVGKAKVTVAFKGNVSGKKTYTFTIVPKGTKFSKVKGAKKAITLKWKAQKSQTTGYNIEVSVSPEFDKGLKKVTVKNSSKSVTIKKLKAKTTYYVRIRTYKKAGSKTYNSSWSTVKKVTTK